MLAAAVGACEECMGLQAWTMPGSNDNIRSTFGPQGQPTASGSQICSGMVHQ